MALARLGYRYRRKKNTRKSHEKKKKKKKKKNSQIWLGKKSQENKSQNSLVVFSTLFGYFSYVFTISIIINEYFIGLVFYISGPLLPENSARSLRV